jgi:hypothetical protein
MRADIATVMIKNSSVCLTHSQHTFRSACSLENRIKRGEADTTNVDQTPGSINHLIINVSVRNDIARVAGIGH